MASRKTLMNRVAESLRKETAPLPSTGSRDRRLHGKARIKARRAARKDTR